MCRAPCARFLAVNAFHFNRTNRYRNPMRRGSEIRVLRTTVCMHACGGCGSKIFGGSRHSHDPCDDVSLNVAKLVVLPAAVPGDQVPLVQIFKSHILDNLVATLLQEGRKVLGGFLGANPGFSQPFEHPEHPLQSQRLPGTRRLLVFHDLRRDV